MKVRILCDHEAASSAKPGTFELVDVKLRSGKTEKRRVRRKGMVLEGPEYAQLLGVGLAEPVDEEAAAVLSPEALRLAIATGHQALMAKNADAVREHFANVAEDVKAAEQLAADEEPDEQFA